MRILHVINDFLPGGILEQVNNIIEYVNVGEGYRHFVTGFRGDVNLINNKALCFNDSKNYDEIINNVKNFEIDIVHKQTGGGDCPDWVRRVQLNYPNIKLVETLHCPRRTAAYRQMDAIIYTTDYTLIQNEGLNKDKFHSIMYPITDREYPENYIETKHTDKDIICVGKMGRIVPEKCWDDMIALADLVYPKYGDRVQFLFAGYIPEGSQYGVKFQEECAKRVNVSYLGFFKDKYEFWDKLDICVNPVWETSFDIVYQEAMNCCIPVVTWDDSAAKYVVEDAGIVTDRNVESLFKATSQLIDGVEERKSFAYLGKKLIQEKYDVKIFKEKFEKMYGDLIA